MTCYLTDDADPQEVVRGFEAGVFAACKLYPANATTNSAHGVTDLRNLRAVFEAMQRAGMPLLIHGEVTDAAVDIFDREAVFIDRALTRSEEHTSELQSLMRISYAVFCLKKKKTKKKYSQIETCTVTTHSKK